MRREAYIRNFGYHGEPFVSLGERFLELRYRRDIDAHKTHPDDPDPNPIEFHPPASVSHLSRRDLEYVALALYAQPNDDVLTENIKFLLESSASAAAQRKTAERANQQPVSLTEVVKPFSARERVHLAKNFASIQLTDGCTVGCNFCGVNALRRTTSRFDLASVAQFGKEVGSHVRSGLLYWASDPFDWVEGDYSYLDMHSMWSAYKREKTPSVYVSTAVPLGTEFSILRWLESSHELVAHNKQANPDKKVPSNLGFRFSRTKYNAARIDAMMAILKQRGLSPDFLEGIDVNDLIVKEPQKMGYLIKHPNRDEIADVYGIACMDGVLITPNRGVSAITMEGVTTQSPRGMGEWQLQPGKMRIPLFCNIQDYKIALEFRDGGVTLFPLFPPVEVLNVENGEVTGRETVHSVRRDILTFSNAYRRLRQIVVFLDENAEWISSQPPQLMVTLQKEMVALRRKFEQRAKVSQSLVEDDQQAKRVAGILIDKLDTDFDEALRVVGSRG